VLKNDNTHFFYVQKKKRLKSHYTDCIFYSLQPDPHNKSKRVSVMIDPEEIERERQKAQYEEQLVLELIGKWPSVGYEH